MIFHWLVLDYTALLPKLLDTISLHKKSMAKCVKNLMQIQKTLFQVRITLSNQTEN